MDIFYYFGMNEGRTYLESDDMKRPMLIMYRTVLEKIKTSKPQPDSVKELLRSNAISILLCCWGERNGKRLISRMFYILTMKM